MTETSESREREAARGGDRVSPLRVVVLVVALVAFILLADRAASMLGLIAR